MKKRDLLVIFAVLMVALLGIVGINAIQNSQSELRLKVSAKGTVYKEIPLTAKANENFTIKTDLGVNKIEIKDGTVGVYEADCPDQVCVHTMPIEKAGEMIVCLPHKVIVEVVKNN